MEPEEFHLAQSRHKFWKMVHRSFVSGLLTFPSDRDVTLLRTTARESARQDNRSLNFAALHPSYAAISAPPLIVRGTFLIPTPGVSQTKTDAILNLSRLYE